MDRKLLINLYPLNLLSPQALDELADEVRIEEYENEDYVYRLWEESQDLRYLIEGKIQIIDASGTKHPILSHKDKQALKPFTHEVADIEAAVAYGSVKILRLDLAHFSSKYLESSGKNFDINAFARPLRSDETTASSAVADFEPLDLPDEDPEIVLQSPQKKKTFAKSLETSPQSKVSNSAKLQASTIGHKSIVQEELESRVELLENLLAKLKHELNVERELAQKSAQPSTVKSNEPQKKSTTKKSTTEQTVKAKPEGNLVQKLKHELTVERGIDLKPLKQSQQNMPKSRSTDQPKVKPVADTVYSENLVQKLKHELTVKRGLDMKPLSPSANHEPEKPIEIQEKKLVSEIDQYLNAMELYKQEKWSSAQAAFENLTNAYPTTNLYSVYATRCTEMKTRQKH